MIAAVQMSAVFTHVDAVTSDLSIFFLDLTGFSSKIT